MYIFFNDEIVFYFFKTLKDDSLYHLIFPWNGVGTLFVGSVKEAIGSWSSSASFFQGKCFSYHFRWESDYICFCFHRNPVNLESPRMWQSCYYIPPSLRYRPAVATTPPSGLFITYTPELKLLVEKLQYTIKPSSFHFVSQLEQLGLLSNKAPRNILGAYPTPRSQVVFLPLNHTLLSTLVPIFPDFRFFCRMFWFTFSCLYSVFPSTMFWDIIIDPHFPLIKFS